MSGFTKSEIIMSSEQNNQQQLSIDEEKLAKLKAKLAAKKESEMSQPIVKKDKSINFGVVGSGQSGSRLAESLYKLGYDAVAINTAQQDLKFIDIPESNKLHLNYGLGGAAKNLEFGKEAAEAYREQISELVNTQLADAQVFILAFSSGGGSGGGSCETLISILSAIGKPIVVITTLPLQSDDAQTKHNAIEVLSVLTKMLQTKVISNLIIVDNAKLEAIYSDVGQMDFFKVANKAIVEPIDIFNTYSSMPSAFKALDPHEWSRILLDGEGIRRGKGDRNRRTLRCRRAPRSCSPWRTSAYRHACTFETSSPGARSRRRARECAGPSRRRDRRPVALRPAVDALVSGGFIERRARRSGCRGRSPRRHPSNRLRRPVARRDLLRSDRRHAVGTGALGAPRARAATRALLERISNLCVELPADGDAIDALVSRRASPSEPRVAEGSAALSW